MQQISFRPSFTLSHTLHVISLSTSWSVCPVVISVGSTLTPFRITTG